MGSCWVRVLSCAAFLAVVFPAGAPAEPVRARCSTAPRALVISLRKGLRPAAGAQITSAVAVRGRGEFGGIFAPGAYFVTADVGRSRRATWAVTPAAFRTGQGGIFAIDPAARSVSVFGSLVAPDLLARWGVSERTKGYTASRACLDR